MYPALARPAGSLSPQHVQLMTHGDQLNSSEARLRKRKAKSEVLLAGGIAWSGGAFTDR